jgi:hypothetical protein
MEVVQGIIPAGGLGMRFSEEVQDTSWQGFGGVPHPLTSLLFPREWEERVAGEAPAGSPRVSLGPIFVLPQEWGIKGVDESHSAAYLAVVRP